MDILALVAAVALKNVLPFRAGRNSVLEGGRNRVSSVSLFAPPPKKKTQRNNSCSFKWKPPVSSIFRGSLFFFRRREALGLLNHFLGDDSSGKQRGPRLCPTYLRAMYLDVRPSK